jgi:hypothetical protein
MKVFNFKTYDDFLERFDGKIYSIAHNDYDNYLCDLHQEDLFKFIDEKKIDSYEGCDFYLKDIKYKQDILSEAIYINIR